MKVVIHSIFICEVKVRLSCDLVLKYEGQKRRQIKMRQGTYK